MSWSSPNASLSSALATSSTGSPYLTLSPLPLREAAALHPGASALRFVLDFRVRGVLAAQVRAGLLQSVSQIIEGA
jgi:hypothetical protein